ncbi:hypothetical protein CSHISOI_10346 [Colletotrichum shisoi]|uniref:Uncharacterized protein n=1 Tax=Colletotrichum shisoi TaxID=2078593 RepID=A0A5Q4BDW2_9PEZI|nr:hypothetical protein CSHISOI_10346 [Colletotrichum shisoi]
MAGFGDTVDSLLETYSICLSRLKGFKGSKHTRQLRKNIRSNQYKVRSVYSLRRAATGNSLEKGDAAARSSLEKVIKRLTSAIARLVRPMRGQAPGINYRSLQLLSNSSRVDAVKTIDDLSRRLGVSSRESTLSGSRATSKQHKRTNSLDKRKNKEISDTELPRGVEKNEERQKAARVNMGTPARIQRMDTDKHMSMTTISSGSTRIGEIMPKKLRPWKSEKSGANDEFTVQPTYPLRPYHQPEVKRRGFWGIFTRGRAARWRIAIE